VHRDGDSCSVEEVFEFGAGCICCSSSGLFMKSLEALSERELDHVLVETTGRADPGPIVQSFAQNAAVDRAFFVHSIVTVVNAERLHRQLAVRAWPLLLRCLMCFMPLRCSNSPAHAHHPVLLPPAQSQRSGAAGGGSGGDVAYKNEVLSQILFADRIVVNKIDLIGGARAFSLACPSVIGCPLPLGSY
jgi:G3E family GTPase